MGSSDSKSADNACVLQGVANAEPKSGEENGHVKTNGDLSPKADGGDSTAVDNGSAEPAADAKAEVGSGDAIEPAPEGEVAPAPTKEVTKKKKRFSFKKPFKLGSISFRKGKKEAPAAEVVASDDKAEAAPEEAKASESAVASVPEQGNEEPAAATEQNQEPSTTAEQEKEPDAATDQVKEEVAQPATDNLEPPQGEPAKEAGPDKPAESEERPSVEPQAEEVAQAAP
ncbi:hypothetical protein NDU88_003293 [Pleurodeles waltl]|uniref:MARCKS-related protein n=1 Tax=Pleurodeles waltl TaxID=8319 RepID=A0AAV7TQ60_PLEWA|nr:hypothetical protein NDU88_003293 [Pleurodeles waltl]